MNFRSAPRIPEVASLPAFSAADKGRIWQLTSDGLLYFNDGTQYRKMGSLGQTTYSPGLRESASASLVVPGSLLNDHGANELEIGGVVDYEAGRLPFGWADPLVGACEAQSSFKASHKAIVLPNAGNVIGNVGFPGTKTGTWVSGGAPATTNTRTRALRQNIPTAATAGSSVGIHYALNPIRVSNGTGHGGFQYRAIFGFNAYTAASRFFVGLRAGTSLIGNVEPSTLVNFFGFGANTTNTTIRRYAAAGVAQASVDTTQTIGTTDLWQVTIFSAADVADEVTLSLLRLSDLTEYTETLTTTIPANTTYLAPVIWINNGANAAVSSLDLVVSYAEWRFTG
jgi:hypothetical protein